MLACPEQPNTTQRAVLHAHGSHAGAADFDDATLYNSTCPALQRKDKTQVNNTSPALKHSPQPLPKPYKYSSDSARLR